MFKINLPLVDDAWVEVHLNWVFGLFPRTMTAVDEGGNHLTTYVLLIFDPLVKANLKWQLECPALLITTPAILWVAIENFEDCVKIPFQKVLLSQPRQYLTFLYEKFLLLLQCVNFVKNSFHKFSI